MYLRLLPASLLISCLLMTLSAAGRELSVVVSDSGGTPLENAVVELVTGEAAQPRPGADYVMDQVDKAFVPELLIVPAGAEVAFPNSDDIRHHVYSFSRAKPFELKLYAGEPKAPVHFDNPGVVVLGCNIHDSMVGYIYVARSSRTQKTGADGVVTFKDVPGDIAGATVWHPNQTTDLEQRIELALSDIEGEQPTVQVTVDTERPLPRNTFEDVFRNAE